MMKQRCLNPKAPDYYNYGGRGIKVCDRWLDFANFYADMGDRPAGMTLDRKDVDGNYEPDNCRWETTKRQCWNKRGSLGEHGAIQARWACIDGGFTQTQVARAFGVHQSLIGRVLSGEYYAGVVS